MPSCTTDRGGESSIILWLIPVQRYVRVASGRWGGKYRRCEKIYISGPAFGLQELTSNVPEPVIVQIARFRILEFHAKRRTLLVPSSPPFTPSSPSISHPSRIHLPPQLVSMAPQSTFGSVGEAGPLGRVQSSAQLCHMQYVLIMLFFIFRIGSPSSFSEIY